MHTSILSWNIRGIRKREKIRAVNQLISSQHPKVILLQETKLEVINGKLVKRLWNLDRAQFSFSPFFGSAGGLLSIWDPDWIQVSQIIVKPRILAIIGFMGVNKLLGGILNVYGPSIDLEKKDFLEEVSSIIKDSGIAWCLGGDWNLFIDPSENIGFSLNQAMIDLFKNFIFEASLLDLSLVGGCFTWCNNRDPPTFVRLDRFLITANFDLAFPNLMQTVLNKSISDHNAICIQSDHLNWGPKPFRFFNHWYNEKGFDNFVISTVKNIKHRNSGVGI
ncbi:hypothetical protein HRI_003283600 [Hibiscus trionum]|uniref:Endonuclease/exonuclease/phosphatase domain-containing protein n=1 Tax=Hibiscus trionum TaxID=183268 RepID=A0A9W7IL67_HIBTR|nr:hypothetical protein HRI_003283600 [Hibiscus trionum]